MKILLTFIFFSSFVYASSAQVQKDTASLNDIANQEISKAVKSRPPLINISLYLDGKLIKKGYTVYVLINGVSRNRTTKRKIVIDTGKLKEGDTLTFWVRYHQKDIYSNKFSYKRFLYGGELIVGIISDYEKERDKFTTDNSIYFAKNQTNKLYDILIRTSKSDADYVGKKYQVEYSVVKSNISSFVNFKYDFIPVINVQ